MKLDKSRVDKGISGYNKISIQNKHYKRSINHSSYSNEYREIYYNNERLEF